MSQCLILFLAVIFIVSEISCGTLKTTNQGNDKRKQQSQNIAQHAATGLKQGHKTTKPKVAIDERKKGGGCKSLNFVEMRHCCTGVPDQIFNASEITACVQPQKDDNLVSQLKEYVMNKAQNQRNQVHFKSPETEQLLGPLAVSAGRVINYKAAIEYFQSQIKDEVWKDKIKAGGETCKIVIESYTGNKQQKSITNPKTKMSCDAMPMVFSQCVVKYMLSNCPDDKLLDTPTCKRQSKLIDICNAFKVDMNKVITTTTKTAATVTAAINPTPSVAAGTVTVSAGTVSAPTGSVSATTPTACVPLVTASSPAGTVTATAGTVSSSSGTVSSPAGTVSGSTGTACAPAGTASAPTGTVSATTGTTSST